MRCGKSLLHGRRNGPLLFFAKKFAPEGTVLGFGGGEVERLAEVVGVALTVLDQLVDYAPVREAAHLAIVDEEVRLELAAADSRAVRLLVGVVAVHGEKLHAAFTAKLDCLVQEFSFAHRPKNQAVSVTLEHLQRRGGKGNLLANGGVFVLDNRTVEINCYGHLVFGAIGCNASRFAKQKMICFGPFNSLMGIPRGL